jgi:hypothetical protein
MNKVVSFLKKKDLYYCVARYYLGGQMIGYGLLKIQGMQCKIITPFSAWGADIGASFGVAADVGVPRVFVLVPDIAGIL